MNSQREYLIGNNLHIQSELAGELIAGRLMIVLGAGASASVGLPNWVELVNKCIDLCNKRKSISPPIERVKKDTSLQLILKRTSVILDKYDSPAEFAELVKECLYSGMDSQAGYKFLLKNDLLIALGSLMMGSKRGNVADVITYNFDDVLEWYLHLHGFVTQIITTPHTLLEKTDVRIYHPHGFVPMNENFSSHDELIFDEASFNKRIGTNSGSLWRTNLESLLCSKTTLFIGISGDDPTFGPMLAKVNESQTTRNILGYWIRKGPENSDNNIADIANKIMPIYVDSYDDIPDFLLDISQCAANEFSK